MFAPGLSKSGGDLGAGMPGLRSWEPVRPNPHQLRSDVEIVRYPDRFQDERGVEFWSWIMAVLEAVEGPGSSLTLSLREP